MALRATAEDVVRVLSRTLADGGLRRLPRDSRRRDIVLAFLCLDMRRRYPYAEAELNDLLQNALERIGASVDHVTCRRYLIDLGFMKRDRAGARYLLNYPKVESMLADEVRSGPVERLLDRLPTPGG